MVGAEVVCCVGTAAVKDCVEDVAAVGDINPAFGVCAGVVDGDFLPVLEEGNGFGDEFCMISQQLPV